MLFFLIIALIIAVVAVVLAIQNTGVVLITFLAWEFEGSLALVLLLTFVLGLAAGLLAVLPKLIKGSFVSLGKNKKIEELQKKLEEKEEKPKDDIV